MGVKNCIVINHDGKDLPELNILYDRVLLDAPCTGLGVISRDQSIKVRRVRHLPFSSLVRPYAYRTQVYKDIQRASHLQKELIRAAIDCTKVGGIIV